MSSRKQQINNDAEKRGSESRFFDMVVEMTNPLSSQEEKNSFWNGYTHKPQNSSFRENEENKNEISLCQEKTSSADEPSSSSYSYENYNDYSSNSGGSKFDRLFIFMFFTILLLSFLVAGVLYLATHK